MSDVSLAKLEGYFTPAELKLIEAGQDLPLAHRVLDSLCLKRVGNVVLNGLIENIGTTMPLEPRYNVIDTAPHPFLTDPAERIDVAVADLPAAKVNSMWELEIKLGVPIHARDIEETVLLNPEPHKHGIRDPQGIIFAAITWRPTETAFRTLDIGDDLLDVNQTAYDEQLDFTRVDYQSDWEARSDYASASELTELMLLLGKAAGLQLPHK